MRDGKVAKQLNAQIAELELELETAKDQAKVHHAMLKYVCWNWVQDIEQFSTRLAEIMKIKTAKERKPALAALSKEWPVEEMGNLTGLVGIEGLSIPINSDLFGVLAENLMTEVEMGAKGLILTIKRPPVEVANAGDIKLVPPVN